MDIQKWNSKTRKYEEYRPDWDVTLYSEDMDIIVNCAGCGQKLKFGDTCTSQQIHNEMGLGYPVCEELLKVGKDGLYNSDKCGEQGLSLSDIEEDPRVRKWRWEQLKLYYEYIQSLFKKNHE